MKSIDDRMRAIFREGAAKINAWIPTLGGWDSLPDEFSIGGERWLAAEAEITQAAKDGDAVRLESLGADYLARIDRFIAHWNGKLTEMNKEAA